MKKNPKSVAFLLPSLSGGGAERTMLNLATGLAGRGYKTDLILLKAIGPYLQNLPEKIRLVDLGARRAMTCLPALAAYLYHEKPSWLVTGLHTNFMALLCKLVPGLSTKVLVSERNTLSVLSKNTNDVRMKLAPLLAKALYPFADGIVAVSEGVAQDLVQAVGIPKNRVQFIYNPVVTPLLRQKAVAPLDDSWFINEHSGAVLAVGSLTAQKDFSTLIEAFALVVRRRSSRLLILGEGRERARLEALVKKHGLHESVKIPGFVLNPYPYMRWAGAFVLSSKWEGLPGVLVEALYCGAPIVATDSPNGAKEILVGGKYGKIVPAGDVKALADGIVSALDGEISRPMSDSWKRFELETVVDRYIDLFIKN